jgi:hypothetical protein
MIGNDRARTPAPTLELDKSQVARRRPPRGLHALSSLKARISTALLPSPVAAHR